MSKTVHALVGEIFKLFNRQHAPHEDGLVALVNCIIIIALALGHDKEETLKMISKIWDIHPLVLGLEEDETAGHG